MGFHWEKQAGLAFPGLVGTQGSHNWDELTEVWINLSIPSCDLDKLRPDGIHFCYDHSGFIQHTVIFEFTRANDKFKFEGFSGDKRAQKHIRYEPHRHGRLLEQITTAPCYRAILVMGVCSSFMVKEWKAALESCELNDSLLSEVYMAAAYGAVEVLAEQ